MATRIFCLIIAIAFLASVVGYSGFLIFNYFNEDSEPPKTLAEINQEHLENLQNLSEELGTLADFEPLTEPLTEPKIEDLEVPEGELAAARDDQITFKFKYALAQTGQIFANSAKDPTGDGTQTQAVGVFCPNWQEGLIGMKPGGTRRLFLPAARVIDCGIRQEIWPSDYDLVIEVELVGIADKTLANFEPLSEPLDELIVEDVEKGDGQAVEADDILIVDYVGALAINGLIFDSGKQSTFSLTVVIDGWQEGLIGMKVGGKRRLLIPAAKAYGDSDEKANIPPNSDLVFDITLIGIE